MGLIVSPCTDDQRANQMRENYVLRYYFLTVYFHQVIPAHLMKCDVFDKFADVASVSLTIFAIESKQVVIFIVKLLNP